MKYRSKPMTFEAIQWNGDTDTMKLMLDEGFPVEEVFDDRYPMERDACRIRLRGGVEGEREWVPVPFDHWVIRPVTEVDDHWVVSNDYFASQYESVSTVMSEGNTDNVDFVADLIRDNLILLDNALANPRMNETTVLELMMMTIGSESYERGMGDDLARWVSNGVKNAERRQRKV